MNPSPSTTAPLEAASRSPDCILSPIRLAERGWIPDALVRIGIRRLLGRRLEEEEGRSGESIDALVEALARGPIAVQVDRANEQHYELPATFFEQILGPRRKYSATYWPSGVHTLEESELASLEQVRERAGLEDGQRILELGCGWGSFCLWAAETFPRAEVTGVSNSASQRRYIEAQAARRGLRNLRILTADMNTFEPPEPCDRIISIEMFEHMRNYQRLLHRISGWLREEGRLFVHIFTHRRLAYAFEDTGREDDWMARHFFTGGMMPSDDLLLRFPDSLRIHRHWRLPGTHYSRTLEAWLRQMDSRKSRILPILEECYGKPEAGLWFNRWRIFLMSCSELFRFREGSEWMVSHYLFRR